MIFYSFGAGLLGFVTIYYISSIIQFKFSLSKLKSDKLPEAVKDRKVALGGILGFILGIFLFNDSNYLSFGSLMCAGMGAGGIIFTTNVKDNYKEEIRRKECIMLFNTLAIFLPTGMSIPQVLNSAKDFSPNLKRAIDKTLAAWHNGTITALDILKKEINLPEGDILASLLLQVSQTGSKNIYNIIQNESRRIDDRRRMLEKIKITRKPIALNIYRFLPLLVLLGLGAGFLTSYAFNQLNQIL
jgi:hypothetical protein